MTGRSLALLNASHPVGLRGFRRVLGDSIISPPFPRAEAEHLYCTAGRRRSAAIMASFLVVLLPKP